MHFLVYSETCQEMFCGPIVIRDHVLKDHTLLAEGPTMQYKLTCHQRPPYLLRETMLFGGQQNGLSIKYCSMVFSLHSV